MNKEMFRRFLKSYRTSKGLPMTPNAVQKRLTEATKAEETLKALIDLDQIVRDEGLMRFAVIALRNQPGARKHNPMGNALRKYYEMVNHREFPLVKE